MSEYDYFSGDPKRIWQDQIAGIINLDYGNFLGAMSDLQGDPDWKQAFSAIESNTGMPEFLNRVQKHFELCQSPHNPDGSVFPYQHPTRTKQSVEIKDHDAMVALMQRYLKTIALNSDNAYEEEEAKLVRKINVEWTENWDSVNDDTDARDGKPAGISIYEIMSDIEDIGEKDGTPTIMSEIRESCYGLASSYDLQKYLMQDFFTHGYDVDALYELEWVHGCSFYFDETTCFVFDEAARNAAKESI